MLLFVTNKTMFRNWISINTSERFEGESVIWRFFCALFNVLDTTFQKGFVVTVDDDGDDDDEDDVCWALLYSVVFWSPTESRSFTDRFVCPWLFKCFRNPPNWDNDYEFFNVCMRSFCTCTHTMFFALYCRIVVYACYCRYSWVIYCVQYDLNWKIC